MCCFKILPDINQWKITIQNNRTIKACQNSAEHQSDVFIQNSWALNESQTSFKEAWPVVCRNGTPKRQTDYLFMCWFDGCFGPSCHTSISNVKGPHLGCVKEEVSRGETGPSQLLSQKETAFFFFFSKGCKFSFSLSCTLFGLSSWIWILLWKKEGKGFRFPDPISCFGSF